MRLIVPLLALTAMLGGCIDIPSGGSKQQGARAPSVTYAASPSARQCISQLGMTQASFTRVPDRYLGEGCSMLNSVRLDSLASDSSSLALANLGPVTCPMANTFAGWARYGVDRAARQILGSPVQRIETMGSYNCRNVAGSSRRSAHATADAIDVSAFILEDGRRVSVLSDWSGGSDAERQFLRIVHASACKRFGVVLGPAYNAAHRDHFHVEIKDGNFCR